MGIRFRCPNGHKINVKSFLAGKRAFCPDCGAKVVVPLESEGAATLGAAIDAQRDDVKARQQDFGVAGASEFADVAPILAAELVMKTPATVSTAAPVSAHAPFAPGASSFAPTKLPAAATESPAVATVVAAPTAAPIQFMPDPIAEAPAAVWYVRPRTGGQYGPAPGDTFRQWISEKRVAIDSLVWRDGWPDWRLASEVLPQFAARPPAFTAAATTLVPPTAPAVPAMAGGAFAPATMTTAIEPDATSAAARYVRARKCNAPLEMSP